MIKTMETILLYELQTFCRKIGGNWRPNFRWSFMEENKLTIATKWENRIARYVLIHGKNSLLI